MEKIDFSRIFSLPFLLGALLVALFFLLVLLNQLTWTLVLVSIALAAVYLLFAQRLHLLLLLVPPALLFGEVLTWNVANQWSYEMTASELLLIFLVFAFLVTTTLQESWSSLRVSRLGVILLAFLGFAILSYFWISDFSKYLVAIRVLLFHLAMFFLVINLVRTRAHVRLLITSLLATIILVSVQLLISVESMGGFSLLFQRQYIRTNIGALATVVAIIVLVLPIAITQVFELFQTKSREPLDLVWTRILAIAAAVIGAGTSLITLGRAGLVSFLAGIFYLTWRLKWKKMILGIFVAAFLVVSVALSTTLFENVVLRWKTLLTDVSNTFRVLEMRTAFDVFADHPVVGVGAGNLKHFYRAILRDYEGESNNFVVQMMAEFGIVGLIILGLLARELWKIIRSSSPLLAGEGEGEVKQKTNYLSLGLETSIVIAALHGMVEATFFGLHYGLFFWMIAGLLVAVQQIE